MTPRALKSISCSVLRVVQLSPLVLWHPNLGFYFSHSNKHISWFFNAQWFLNSIVKWYHLYFPFGNCMSVTCCWVIIKNQQSFFTQIFLSWRSLELMYKGGRLKKPFSLTGLSSFFANWTTGNTAFTVCGKAADRKSTLCTGGGWPNSLTCDLAPTYLILMCYLVWLCAFCFLKDTFCYQWHNTGKHHVLLVSEMSLIGFRVTLRLCWG